MIKTGKIGVSSLKAGMDEKTARKYLRVNKPPSQCKKEHTWRTRKDPFEDDWEEVKEMLEIEPGLEAKTLFEYLQRENPGKYSDGQLRTLQRRVKVWRATEGPGKEIFFPQVHKPGALSESDFTHMNKLGITINREPFPHLIYHFVLTYSNWEACTICYSESYESLSEGFQNALWKLGGVPKRHRTDRMTAAVHKECNPEEFTPRYKALLAHYRITGEKIRVGKAHENGDVEQLHNRFKRAVRQELLLRGSTDFSSREEYSDFIQTLLNRLNKGREKRLREEIRVLRELPSKRIDDCSKGKAKVGPSSTIQVRHNTYSVHSRLIREWVNLRIYAEHIEVWYGQKKLDILPRLRGDGNHCIQYRHIIDWLVRKPGAFANYRYREDLFPSSYFRMAYDNLIQNHVQRKAEKEYLQILHIAAYEGELKVETVIKMLLAKESHINSSIIKEKLNNLRTDVRVQDVEIAPVDLNAYDLLLILKNEEADVHG